MDMIAPFIAYSAALAVAAVIPGPGIAALVGQALGSGLRTSLFFIAGIALGDILYLTVAIAGLAAVVQLFAGAFLIVKILGGTYLLYLAYKFWRSEAGLSEVNRINNRSGFKAFLTGLAVTIGNPKAIVFYLALVPTVLNLGQVGVTEWIALSGLTMAVLFVTLTPYALLASKARRMMTRTEMLTRLNRFAAGIIGSAGVLIIGQAATALARRT